MKRLILMFLMAFLWIQSPVQASEVPRISGSNRYLTAVEISKRTYDKADVGILINGKNYVDALAASSLANHFKAPILLVSNEGIGEEVKDEMTRLGISKLYIIGGKATISAKIEKELLNENYEVQRLAGKSRYETSVEILKELMKTREVKKVMVASNPADALTSSAFRGDDKALVLMKDGEIPAILKSGDFDISVIGGNKSISLESFNALGASRRLGGKNRFETALILAELNNKENGAVDGLLVNSEEFADALTVSTYAFKNKLNIFLSPGSYIPEDEFDYIKSKAINLTIIGGESSVQTAALERNKAPEPEKPKEPDPSKPMVALTFDGGPTANISDEIIKLLKENDAKATFFVMGVYCEKRPDLIKAEVEAGFELGNHSYDHPHFTQISREAIRYQIDKTQNIIKNATGFTPTIMRAPFGERNQWVDSVINMPVMHWALDTLDWKYQNSDRIYNQVMTRVKDGDIVLMHDTMPTTLEAVKRIVPELKKKGFQMVTVSEMFKAKNKPLVNGKVYENAR